MDASRALVSKIVQSGQRKYLDAAKAAGVTPEKLRGDCAEAWSYIVSHADQYDDVPSGATLVKALPSFETEHSSESFAFILDQWGKSYARMLRRSYLIAEAKDEDLDGAGDRFLAFGAELKAIGSGKSGRTLTYTSDVDVTKRAVTWFWKHEGVGWIPNDALTVLSGDPGEGKGLFTVWLTALAVERGVNVGILGHEDEKGLQCSRLDAAGVKPGSTTFIEFTNPDGSIEPLSFPSDLGALRKSIEDNDLGLVIIDPINSHMDDGIKSSDDKDVRRVLSPLSQLAQDLGVVFVVVHHLSKGTTGSKLLYRSGGAVAYTGVARQVITIGKKVDVDEDDADEMNARYVFQAKSNYTKRTNAALRFEIVEREVKVETRGGLPSLDHFGVFDSIPVVAELDESEVFSPPLGRGRPKDDSLREWVDQYVSGKATIVPDTMRDAMNAAGFPDGKWRSVRNIVREEKGWTSERMTGARNAYEWRAPSFLKSGAPISNGKPSLEAVADVTVGDRK